METLSKLPLTGSESLSFSYGQVIAYDAGEQEPGSIWTDQHINQGFVRRPHSVGIRTLIQDGTATISVFRAEPASLEAYVRVISVPIELPSGVLRLEGPDEFPVERFVNVGVGVYRLTFCQAINADGDIRIDIFVGATAEADPRSRVLKADGDLSGFADSIETGSVG